MNRCKHTLLVLLISLLGVSCSEETLHIHGNITSMPDETVYLRVYEGTLRTIDSTQSVNGLFQFDLPKILPNMVYLQFSGSEYFIPILIDMGEVSVGGNYNYPEEIEVTGTPANETLNEYRKRVYQYDVMLTAIDKDLNRIKDDPSDSTIMKQLIAKRAALQARHNNFRTEFVRANRGSLVSAFLVANSVTDSTSKQQIDSLIGELEPSMADNAFLRQLHRKRKTQ